jgi:hypothetical protein
MRPVSYRSFVLLAVFSLAAAGARAGQDTAQIKEQTDDTAALKKFTVSVDGYLTLRRSIEKKLPALKNKEELPEMISAHQQALARKIREGRPDAKPGDIFTREVREAFRHVIRSVFQDPKTAVAHSTVQQQKTVQTVPLRVNGVYPDAVAETTFPSSLLQKLPQLPDELAYRIVGRDLVLVDSKANLVVDWFHEALPQNLNGLD